MPAHSSGETTFAVEVGGNPSAYGAPRRRELAAATGLHGITSALFARRSKEFVIRLALGASPRHIMGTIVASAMRLTAVGLAISLPCGMFMASQVRGFTPWSVSALGLSTAIVLVAAVAAAVQPASRVLRTQPGDIVRAE